MDDLTKIEEKIAKKETLTEDEIREVKSIPNDDITARTTAAVEEEAAPAEEPKPEAKKPEPPPAPPAPEKKEEDMMVKLERELAKPEGQEDLKTFTEREKAYFWNMRRDRRARQKAEEERDAMRFKEIKREAEAKARKEEPPVEKDMFDGRDENDFLTIAEAKKIREALKAKKEVDGPKSVVDVNNPVTASYLRMCEEQAKTKFEDFDEVIELVPEILSENQAYQQKVLDAMVKGENPAVVLYGLIKGDPEYARLEPLGKARKAAKATKPETPPAAPAPSAEEIKQREEAKKKEEALKNQPPKTSGHASGSEGTLHVYSADEIMRMSDKEFSKLPKKERDLILRQHG